MDDCVFACYFASFRYRGEHFSTKAFKILAVTYVQLVILKGIGKGILQSLVSVHEFRIIRLVCLSQWLNINLFQLTPFKNLGCQQGHCILFAL